MMLRRLLIGLVLALCISEAHAQTFPFCSLATISQPQNGFVQTYCGSTIGNVWAPGVFQSGTVTAGHIAQWNGAGVLVDGGNPSGTGTVTSVGVAGTGGLTASPSPITGAGTLTLNVFGSSLPGGVPASGGGTTNFLRADGSWAAPPGGGSSSFPANVRVLTAGASDTASIGDAVYWNKTSGSASTENLPACSSGAKGQAVSIIDEKGDSATNNITVTPNGTDKVLTQSTYVMNSGFQSLILQCDGGGNWAAL